MIINYSDLMGWISIGWGKIIKEALIFGVSPKRFLPYFIADVTATALGLCYIFLNSSLVMEYSLSLETGTIPSPEFASAIAPLLLLFLVWYLVKVYIDAAVMKQVLNPKPKDFGKCWTGSKEIYPVFLITAIIVGLATTLVRMLGDITGDILTIIATLLLMFALPAVIVDKKNIAESLSKSIDIFRKRWMHVLLSLLFITATSFFIALIAIIPTLILFSGAVIQFFTTNMIETEMLFYIMQNSLLLIICGLVFMVGWAMISAVKMNLLVTLYRKLNK